MDWLSLTILAVIARSTYSVATKLLSKQVKISSVTQSILLGVFAGVLVLPLSLLIGGINFNGVISVWQATLVMVISQAFGNILFFQGLKTLDAGTTQIAFSSILIWGAILSAIYLDSTYSGLQLIGIFLMLIAILLVQYRKSFKLDKGIMLIIASAGLFAIFQVASAKVSNIVNTGAYLILAYLGSAFLLSAIYLKTLTKDMKLLVKQVTSTSLSTLFASGSSLLYFMFSYFAYQIAPDRGVVVILLTAQVILSVIFGIIFLKERENMTRKIIAGILAVAASILIKA